MWWLIVLDPEFWCGVALAAWALYGDLILIAGMLAISVSMALYFIYKSIMARREHK